MHTNEAKISRVYRPAAAVCKRTSGRTHAALAAVSIVALGVSNAVLTSFYTRSGHPVSYAEGQLAFDGETIKGYYADMSDLGSLDTYVATQFVDFSFILSVLAVGVFVASLVARAADLDSRTGRAASLAGVFLVVGALFDVLENMISFIMLADADGFPNPLAIAYSSAAAVKFAAMAIGIVLLLGALVALIAKMVAGRR